MSYEERTVSTESIYKGRIISLSLQKVELPNGKIADREIIIHPGGAFTIPLCDNGEVYMVRQFRKPMEKDLLELPAGKLDMGEEPLECAIRELKEETGLTASSIKHVMTLNTAPAFCNEKLYMFLATGLNEGESCKDEDEFLHTEKYHIDDLMDMVLNGEITDAKTVAGIFYAHKVYKEK